MRFCVFICDLKATSKRHYLRLHRMHYEKETFIKFKSNVIRTFIERDKKIINKRFTKNYGKKLN
jgi:hypothetical protein